MTNEEKIARRKAVVRKSQDKRREKYKAERRCVSCGKQDERTLSGKVHCESCNAADKLYRSETRQYLISRHRCVQCKAKDERTMRGLTLCQKCADKQAESRRMRSMNR